MKAIRIHGRGGPEHLVYEDAPQPHPGQGEVLVRVSAAGVIANELRWDETYQTKTGDKRVLPIPGRDLSGVVEEVGPGTPMAATVLRLNLLLLSPANWLPSHTRSTLCRQQPFRSQL